MMGWIFHFVVFCEMCHVWRFAPGVWRFAPGVFGASRPVSSASRPSVWRFAPQILTLAPASVKTAFSQPGIDHPSQERCGHSRMMLGLERYSLSQSLSSVIQVLSSIYVV
jgi:hypothetical protein